MARGVRLPIEQLQPYLLEIPGLRAGHARAPAADGPGPLDFREAFGNGNPVEVEVGFGKGLFLLTAAESRPGVNFLGVEVERKYHLFTANRVARRQLANVRLVCGDAKMFLPRCIHDGSLQAVHVYFPDPWWKNRHRKRRLFTADFAAECRRVLRVGGRLHLASDVEDYFHIITALVRELPDMVEATAPAGSESGEQASHLTNFERKYRQEGRPIYRAVYVREGEEPIHPTES